MINTIQSYWWLPLKSVLCFRGVRPLFPVAWREPFGMFVNESEWECCQVANWWLSCHFVVLEERERGIWCNFFHDDLWFSVFEFGDIEAGSGGVNFWYPFSDFFPWRVPVLGVCVSAVSTIAKIRRFYQIFIINTWIHGNTRAQALEYWIFQSHVLCPQKTFLKTDHFRSLFIECLLRVLQVEIESDKNSCVNNIKVHSVTRNII